MFTFALLTPEKGNHSFRASLLTLDNDINILADPTWNGSDHKDVDFMESNLRKIDVILLSHSMPEFISGFIILCVKFPHIMSKIPIYSTLPVNQLGRVSTVEFYRSKGVLGPLKDALMEVDEVDDWFDKAVPLKYSQTLSLFENKMIITPYNAGHTLGGTFWCITKRLEKVIYAPSWNHSKDSFLSSSSFLSASTGNPLSQLMRPTVLITNTDLGSNLPHKKRAEKFLQLMDATLANGGAVVLPTSLSGRFLELLHLVDHHLQSQPIPVYFLSYSGTKVLNYASSLLEWMSTLLVKEWEAASSASMNSTNKNNFPFDPSKVDLLLDPKELIQLSGPKIVLCAGIDMNSGDVSFEVLKYLCLDQKNTVLLTEKTHFGADFSINAQLFTDWVRLSREKYGNAEDGLAIGYEGTIPLRGLSREDPLSGSELTSFQERINHQRKKKLFEQVRDRKNQNLLNADNLEEEDSSSDDGEDAESSDEEMPTTTETEAGAMPGAIDTNVNAIVTQDAFVADQVKQTLDDELPLDVKITHKLKPRQAMFPYIPPHKRKFDDYGEVIDIKDYQRAEDLTNAKLILDSKRKFEQEDKLKWGNDDDRRSGRGGGIQTNRLTPQETLNNQILQKNLHTLFQPRKRVIVTKTQDLKFRCSLSFVDLAGLVDLRSLSLIVSSLKPYNLVLLPDPSKTADLDEEYDGLPAVKKMFEQLQAMQEKEQNKLSLLHSSRALSLVSIRGGLSGHSSGKYSGPSRMAIHAADYETSLKIGVDEQEDSLALTNFEVVLEDEIVDTLKWQKVDGNYRVAPAYGELELHNPHMPRKKAKTVPDYINPSTQFSLKYISKEEFMKRQTEAGQAIVQQEGSSGPKFAIGNIRLPELKRKLIAKEMNAEFKGEGTLVVNGKIAIRKVTYGSIDGDDTGDIEIDGTVGPLYYKVKACIKEMLAYI